MADSVHADLVLSGGGVKGVALVGAVASLVRAGYVPQRVSGTSAGALVGAVLAAATQSGDLSAAQLESLAMDIDYRTFLDPGPIERVPVLGPAWGVLTGGGIYRGDALRDWVAAQLADFGVRTFADLAISDSSLPPEQRYRLVVTVADVSLGQLIRLPWDYQRIYGLDPDVQLVADAVRASTAIPFFYRPASLTSADGRVFTLVDGGLLSNFPIDSLDRTDDEDPRWPTFGVTLLPTLPAENEQVIPALRPLRRLGSPMLLEQVVTTTLVGRDQAYLNQPRVSARTIRIDTRDVGVLDFDLSEQDKRSLYQSGQRAGEDFLSTWDWSSYTKRFR
ncbi:MAG: patatin-like phospholipase family protein [Mycobacterium sp.]